MRGRRPSSCASCATSSTQAARSRAPSISRLSTSSRHVAVATCCSLSPLSAYSPSMSLLRPSARSACAEIVPTRSIGWCCAILILKLTGLQTFDEMLLLKRGGSVIYNGPLGEQSGAMIAYFECIAGVQPISKGYSASPARSCEMTCTSCHALQPRCQSRPSLSSRPGHGPNMPATWQIDHCAMACSQ